MPKLRIDKLELLFYVMRNTRLLTKKSLYQKEEGTASDTVPWTEPYSSRLLFKRVIMSATQLTQLEADLHNARARQFRRNISQVERQRLQEKIAWLKQRIVEMRRCSQVARV